MIVPLNEFLEITFWLTKCQSVGKVELEEVSSALIPTSGSLCGFIFSSFVVVVPPPPPFQLRHFYLTKHLYS